MIRAKDRTQDGPARWLEAFEARPAAGPAWLATRRRLALRSFSEKGFPSTRDEQWKYTSLAPLLRADLAPVPSRDEPTPPAGLAEHFLERTAARLVFLDGRLAPELSHTASSPPLSARGLARALADERDLEAALGGPASSAFEALNLALFEDGALVRVAPRSEVADPIQLVFATTRPGAAAHVRVLVELGESSRARVVETWVGPDSGPSLANGVSELTVGANASLEHEVLQVHGPDAFHVATVAVRLARDARFASRLYSFGSALARNELRVAFDGPGAECELDGLYVVDGEQHVDSCTFVDHSHPRCTSRQRYRGVVGGRARGVFQGRVLVRQDAQHSDASQSNKNLLLSDEARADTKPQLEIFADDVKCAHGATIGQLDGAALFYLRSRGLPLSEARYLLTRAFAAEVADASGAGELRSRVYALLAERLGGTAEAGRAPEEVSS